MFATPDGPGTWIPQPAAALKTIVNWPEAVTKVLTPAYAAAQQWLELLAEQQL